MSKGQRGIRQSPGKRSGTPGGMRMVVEPPRKNPSFHGTEAERARIGRTGEFNRAHPVLAEDGVYLGAREIYNKIIAEGRVVGPEDEYFMEGFADHIRAHKEVGRRFPGSLAQARRLSDIYRRCREVTK